MQGRFFFFPSRVVRSLIKNQDACKICKAHGSKAYSWDKAHQLECLQNGNATAEKGHFNDTICYQKLHYLRRHHRNVFHDWIALFPPHFGEEAKASQSLISNISQPEGFNTLREAAWPVFESLDSNIRLPGSEFRSDMH